mmetsp:Transcript_16271/g.37385  ORF Transcript_16271/g.37385 Transcript_16271/m.37385 type:complete len:118 (+) Transcript_16271:538-891(+)
MMPFGSESVRVYKVHLERPDVCVGTRGYLSCLPHALVQVHDTTPQPGRTNNQTLGFMLVGGNNSRDRPIAPRGPWPVAMNSDETVQKRRAFRLSKMANNDIPNGITPELECGRIPPY